MLILRCPMCVSPCVVVYYIPYHLHINIVLTVAMVSKVLCFSFNCLFRLQPGGVVGEGINN